MNETCHTHATSVSIPLDAPFSLVSPPPHMHTHTCVPHTATFHNTLQHTATHCNTLQHPATPCNTLQHAAACCIILQHTATDTRVQQAHDGHTTFATFRCNNTIPLQHTAKYCNIQQLTLVSNRRTACDWRTMFAVCVPVPYKLLCCSVMHCVAVCRSVSQYVAARHGTTFAVYVLVPYE